MGEGHVGDHANENGRLVAVDDQRSMSPQSVNGRFWTVGTVEGYREKGKGGPRTEGEQ